MIEYEQGCMEWCRCDDGRGEGWCASEILDLGDDAGLWITHNEPWNSASGGEEYALVIDNGHGRAVQFEVPSDLATLVARRINQLGVGATGRAQVP